MADSVPGAPGGDRKTSEDQRGFDLAGSAGLFIGVSSFEDGRIVGVPFAVDDAVDLAHRFVVGLQLVLPARATLLASDEPKKPKSQERLAELLALGVVRRSARLGDVYDALEELAGRTGPGGLTILSSATHGLSDAGGDFLLASDSRKGRQLEMGVKVPPVFDDLARVVEEAGSGRALVFLDACRNRFIRRRSLDEPEAAPMSSSFAKAIARARGIAVLAGAPLGGFSYDDPKRQNGVFTAAVLDGLEGQARPGPDGWITLGTLAEFVQANVASWVRRNFPEDAGRSRGIELRLEPSALGLPLAPHPEATRERERYRERREKALARMRENLGDVLDGGHWNQVRALLPSTVPTPAANRLLDQIKALNGTEFAQRGFRDFLRELAGREDHPPRFPPLDSIGPLLSQKTTGEKPVHNEPNVLEEPRPVTPPASSPSASTVVPLSHSAALEPPSPKTLAPATLWERWWGRRRKRKVRRAVITQHLQRVAVGREEPEPTSRRQPEKRPWSLAFFALLLFVGAAMYFRPWQERDEGVSLADPASEEPANPKAGDAWVTPAGIRFRFVPSVNLVDGVWLAETELTQAQWNRLAPGEHPWKFGSCGADCPVESVTWYAAAEFANRMSAQENLISCYSFVSCTGTIGGLCDEVTFASPKCPGYRLPFEAEWEMAARMVAPGSQITTPVYAGEYKATELDLIAWYRGNSGVAYPGAYDCSGWQEKHHPFKTCGPHPVGQKMANAWGFRDLLGNVSEWTGDSFPKGSHPVIRGGSWDASAWYERAASRVWVHPGARNQDIGFRLARGQGLRFRR